MAKTNFEVIGETPETLADFLCKVMNCPECPCFGSSCNGGVQTICRRHLLGWLAQTNVKNPSA